ncbi:MAG: hypothetical protein K9G76_07905 [Bacteroidales bacterium]|nr:hypothetical protein [Bacteroidales bacterium]MCF8404775.1 hypothetical protein [Bacteroidales bacterium]
MDIIDWIGFIGISQILLAYFLNVIGQVNYKDWSFLLLNLIGAGMACLASILLNYLPFVILEGAWTFISFVSIVRNKLIGR